MISRMALSLSLLTSLTMFGATANASEPSALEVRQLQTRIFEAPPIKVISAMIELCNNIKAGSSPVYSPSNLQNMMNQGGVNLVCMGPLSFGGKGPFNVSYIVESEKNSKAARVRMRLQKLELVSPQRKEWVQSFDSADYEAVYKSLADVLLLNDIGVDVKVYR